MAALAVLAAACGSDGDDGTASDAGNGQITPVGAEQQLRGIQGPTDQDFGVYRGRNDPPYIRIISGDFS